MREKPLRGDRSRKQDDRYLFLEALLSARDRFIVLYTGQSVKDNSELSPSIFISQIHDYLERVYQFPSSTYTFDHRLQPFSPSSGLVHSTPGSSCLYESRRSISSALLLA